jgi:lysophospholipase L1-like esterase
MSQNFKTYYAVFLLMTISFTACSTPVPVALKSDTSLFPSSNTPIQYQQDWQKELYLKRIQEFQAEPIGCGKIVFLGNSLTEGGANWNEKFGTEKIVNRGISGDITEGILARLHEVTYYKPNAVFLLIGINDIFAVDIPEVTPAYVANNIQLIAARIHQQSPTTLIFVQTILPVNPDIYLQEKGWFPESRISLKDRINSINTMISQLNKNEVYKVIDLHTAFSNDQGSMQAIYTTDGVHLSEAGYENWVRSLQEYIQPLLHTVETGSE